MAIRILHIVDTMLGMGGMEKGVVNLIRRMDPGRFEHVVCVLRSLGTLADSIPADRGRVLCLGETGSGMRFQALTLARQIEAVKPDIVHSRNWGTIESVFAGRWFGSCAVVHSEHGMESYATEEPRRRRWLRRLAFQLADRVFSVSYALRDYHALRTGFPALNISVIHNGVDTDLFRQRPEGRRLTRARYGLDPDEFCIGTVGRLEPIKDMITLLRAATELPDSMNWRIVIAGEGRDLPALNEFLRDRPEVRKHILFLGEIQDVPGFLGCIDVYVLPSLYEGISNSLLEAMASGLAVVASSVGGNPEVVVDGESGLLFPVERPTALAERLMTLHRDAELRLRLGRQAIYRIKESFSLESMVRAYERMYLGTLAR
jgi:sugar transferase (PEP-CTERM/EpsH1 system associated)